MAREIYPIEVIQVALSRAEGMPFERFAHEFQSHLLGGSFVPTGGLSDGGADGVLDGTYEVAGRATGFLQVSIRKDVETKIRQTVARLKNIGRDPRNLVYFTTVIVPRFDIVESSLSDELDVTIRIRDGDYVAKHINDSPETQAAFNKHLSHYAEFLRSVGSSRLIPTSAHVKSPAVYTFLAQEIARRNGDTSSLDAMVDALALWALEGTDPDDEKLMSRAEILEKIVTELPSVGPLVTTALDRRLEDLSEKGTRLVRWYHKRDLFCLPFETRLTIEADNAADVLLQEAVRESLRSRLRMEGEELNPDEIDLAAEVALRTLQATFEKQGLEFAAFLTDATAVTEHPDIASSITDALGESGVFGTAATRMGPFIFQTLKQVLYSSNEVEREYLQKLSATYALLFILNTEPRLMEFFQDMAGDFYLYVGSDQLLKALSEQYLAEEDQMARNALRIATSMGATLVLTQPVLDEVVGHFRRSDAEWKNHIAKSEEWMTYDLARNVGPIILRAYLYARIDPSLSRRPKSWQHFVQQFCSYEDLNKTAGENDFLGYLVKSFSMEFVSVDDLELLVHIDDVAALARKLGPHKSRQELADNDALLAHAVYGRREAQKEIASQNEFGFATWWLTGESSILRQTADLVKARKGARYIMRPEFLLHFVTLAPSATEARMTYARIFPSLLGIRLAKRLDDKAFHAVMEKVDQAIDLDESRRSTAIASIVDKMKGDFTKTYATNNVNTNSIDLTAMKAHD